MIKRLGKWQAKSLEKEITELMQEKNFHLYELSINDLKVLKRICDKEIDRRTKKK